MMSLNKRIKQEVEEGSSDFEPPRKKEKSSFIAFQWRPEEILCEEDLPKSVSRNICNLFDDGCSIPFIARYRRDRTNDMTADDLRDFQERYESLKNVRIKVEKLAEQVKQENKLTPRLKRTLECLTTPEELELVSAPYKAASKQTLAARAKAVPGMAELAEKILHSTTKVIQIELQTFIHKSTTGRKNLTEVETSVGHIITDLIVHDSDVMQSIRDIIKSLRDIRIVSSKREGKAEAHLKDKYQNYHDFSIDYRRIKPHQTLALNRGVSEKFLSLKVSFPDKFKSSFVNYCFSKYGKHGDKFRYKLLLSSIEDGYKRLILPSAQRRIRSELTKSAMKESINVFAMNLRKLLLTPPLLNKIILGIDPGFKNGCKMAVIGMDGSVLGTGFFYLHKKASVSEVLNLLRTYDVEFIALGNGTACRETEQVLTDLIRDHSLNVKYTIVNETGASIYSCSKLAKTEFPDMDPNLISAVSIASRLRDPLAEYLKIEPKNLGVGMYQHDVSESKLKATLEEILSECVSFVGVDLNSAPAYLLEKVSGLNKTNANDIISWRNKNRRFDTREDLKKIKGIGKKKFELCAGFVRLHPCKDVDLSNPLDSTLIHPESYDVAKDIIFKNGFKLKNIGTSKIIQHFKSLSSKSGEHSKTEELIVQCLSVEPRSDLRELECKPLFRAGVLRMSDLIVESSVLQGRVVNVTHFGAFVDCGVGVDGLVHSSGMSGHVLELGNRVRVMVKSLDEAQKRLGLRLIGLD